MKVYIGPHKNWYGPYQVSDMLRLLGVPRAVRDKIGERLDSTWVRSALNKLHEMRGGRRVRVRIDYYDTWNLDSTISMIVLPLLEKYKKIKNGSPVVDDVDVPESLRRAAAPPLENEWDLDELHHDRWDWVVDEMIWAHRSIVEDDGLSTDEEVERRQRGLLLFGKYYSALWD